MQDQPPNYSKESKSRSSSIPPPTTSCGGSYMIRLSGLSIFIAILSSASIALFSGRVASFYLPTQQQPQLQYQPVQTMLTEAAEKMINCEALVHPAMITHLNPKRVAVLGGKQQDQTSATLREVLKHVTVQEAFVLGNKEEETHVDKEVGAMTSVLVMKDQECSSGGHDHALFDVIIDPNPVKVATDFSSRFHCLDHDGVLALNIDTTITNKDSALGVGRLEVLGGVIDALEEVGYKSVHLYEDESIGFGARSFLVALKSSESRAEWYSNEAEIDIRLHQRIGRTKSLEFFDSPTMLKYQVPSKAVENAYCQGDGDDSKREWCENRGFDPELMNVPLSDLTVGKSTMGEFSGRGLFAANDIPRGRSIGIEKSWLNYFIFPSTHRLIFELYNWADQNSNEGEYVEEVLDSISAVAAFSDGYGFWSSLFGRAHSTVDSGLMMFCNHGCNGTFNLRNDDFANYTEANVDPNQPPESIFLSGSAFSPVLERNLRQMLTSGDKTNRDIKKGEEILCNYLEFIGSASHWAEDIRGLQGQCAGTEVGEISAYELDELPKIAATAAADTQEVLITDMINWLRANGAFINDKLQIRHINPDDPSSPRGLFALESLEEGETVCNIPWELIISPSEKVAPQSERYKQLDCGTIDAVIKEISKSESDMTPYGKYLLNQPRGYTLGFWSSEGQNLFWEMTDDEKLPPVWIEAILQDWEEECGGNAENSSHLFAMMLVKARADYQYLVPFYDMMNHHNRKNNVVHKYNSYKDPIDKTGYEIVTSKSILAGDELFLSYNHCAICDQYYDWFGTPEMFLHFGFVEGYPQRWLFDFARVKFDLDWKDGDEKTGEVVVNFLVPPSTKGMELLKHELDRLDKFGQKREQTFSEGDVPEYELKSLWEYYDALHDALRYALESNVTLVDDVWLLMDDNWWVKDGSLKAEDVGEHTVRPSE